MVQDFAGVYVCEVRTSRCNDECVMVWTWVLCAIVYISVNVCV